MGGREKTTWEEMSERFAITTVNSFFFMTIVNHSNSRGFFAFAPDVRRHESSENCQKML